MTQAYLTLALTPKYNPLNLGNTNITVTEDNVPDPGDVPTGQDTKHVQLSYPAGPGCVPGVVRATIGRVAQEGSDQTSGDFAVLPAPDGDEITLGDIVVYLDPDWLSNWFYKDGYFYYRNVLNPGETTPYLVVGVTYANAGDYDAKEIHINVLADILQASGGAPAAEWGVNVTGAAVSP